MSLLWGELPPETETDLGIAAIERAEITKPKQLETNERKDENKLNDNDKVIATMVVPIGNPIMIHSIQLTRFIKKLETFGNNFTLFNDISLPQLSQTIDKSLIYQNNLSELTVKKLIRRAVILILAYYGYEMTSESIIDILVDVTCHYLKRMCRMLRFIADGDELRSSNDFVDIIDRVFHEMNVYNCESLRQYDAELCLKNYNLQSEAKTALKRLGINDTVIPVIENPLSECENLSALNGPESVTIFNIKDDDIEELSI